MQIILEKILSSEEIKKKALSKKKYFFNIKNPLKKSGLATYFIYFPLLTP